MTTVFVEQPLDLPGSSKQSEVLEVLQKLIVQYLGQ